MPVHMSSATVKKRDQPTNIRAVNVYDNANNFLRIEYRVHWSELSVIDDQEIAKRKAFATYASAYAFNNIFIPIYLRG